MRVRQEYPTPIDGVSTTAAIIRGPSTAEAQVNMRSNPVAKLTRRPSLIRDAVLTVADNSECTVHAYKRKGSDYRILAVDDSIRAFKDGIEKTVTDTSGSYLSQNLAFATINDTTFISNKDVVTATKTRASVDWPEVSHINIIDALNYGEELTLSLETAGWVGAEAVITISSDPNDYETADQERGTGAVATAIATQINGYRISDDDYPFAAKALGSSVAIYTELNTPGVIPSNQEVNVTVKSGQGADSVKVFNKIADSVDGLPLYAREGTVIQIQKNARSDDGIFYLEATTDATATYVNDFPNSSVGDELVEVSWSETTSRTEDYELDEDTLPHALVYDHQLDKFTLGPAEWDHRISGDDVSCPIPDFVGDTIEGLNYFQKRLVFLSENEVFMTRTDNIFSWFKKSAVELLVTDPVGITSSASDTDFLAHVIPHNKDLLIISSNGQFKISGAEAVTPRNAAMPLTTAYDCQTAVPPVAIGATVFIPSLYGSSTGMLTYEGIRGDDKDIASSVTNHVIGYMPGTIKKMKASSNLSMLALTVTDTAENVMFVYERELVEGGKLAQSAWSQWTFPEETIIKDFTFENDVITVICAEGNDVVVKTLNMFSEKEANPDVVFLDDLLYLDHDGSSVTVPDDYPYLDDLVIVEDADGDFPMMEVNYTRSNRTYTFEDTYTVGKVYIGRRFKSSYTPTRPFVRDKNGKSQDFFRLRVNRWIPTVVNSGPVSFKIISEIADYADQISSGRIMGTSTNLLGEETPYTGEHKFAYSQNADTALAEFYTEHHLGMTITALRWEGQYHARGKNI